MLKLRPKTRFEGRITQAVRPSTGVAVHPGDPGPSPYTEALPLVFRRPATLEHPVLGGLAFPRRQDAHQLPPLIPHPVEHLGVVDHAAPVGAWPEFDDVILPRRQARRKLMLVDVLELVQLLLGDLVPAILRKRGLALVAIGCRSQGVGAALGAEEDFHWLVLVV